jgi:hypothetical protein
MSFPWRQLVEWHHMRANSVVALLAQVAIKAKHLDSGVWGKSVSDKLSKKTDRLRAGPAKTPTPEFEAVIVDKIEREKTWVIFPAATAYRILPAVMQQNLLPDACPMPSVPFASLGSFIGVRRHPFTPIGVPLGPSLRRFTIRQFSHSCSPESASRRPRGEAGFTAADPTCSAAACQVLGNPASSRDLP